MTTHLLAIGIAEYDDPDLRLPVACRHDATAMMAALQARHADLQVTPLLDGDASKANIKAAVEAMTAQAGADDRVIFYYSGHGARQFLGNSEEGDLTEEYYVPADARSEKGLDAWIRDDELHAWLTPLTEQVREVVMILDSCHSGGALLADDDKPVAKELTDEKVAEFAKGGDSTLDLPAFDDGELVDKRLFIAASQARQKSFVLPGAPNSLFTQVFLEFLASNRYQDYQALFADVAGETSTVARMNSVEQDPHMLDGVGAPVSLT